MNVIRSVILCGLAVCLSPLARAALAQSTPALSGGPAAIDRDGRAVASASAGVVNLNTASADELDRLPGIGPSRARAILELRAQLKRFARLEDLMRVRGIGRATFRRLRPLLTLSGPTTLTSTGARAAP